MSHDYIQGLDCLKGDAGQTSRQSLVKGLQADTGHPLDGDFEAAVFALSRNGYLQLYLWQITQKGRGDNYSAIYVLAFSDKFKVEFYILCLGLWVRAWQCKGFSSHRIPAYGHQRFVF